MLKTSLSCLLLCVAFASPEVLDNVPCSTGPDSRNIRSQVHEIRVVPCAEAENDEPCRLLKNSNATIEVDFTPDVGARRPKAGMFWMSAIDLPFTALKSNACANLPCPIRAGTRYTYSTTLELGSHLPSGQYPIKLKVGERKNIIFCQTLRIKLVDSSDA